MMKKVRLQKGDLSKLMKFFLKPSLNFRNLFSLVRWFFDVLSDSPDLLGINAMANKGYGGDFRRVMIVLTDSSKIELVLVISADQKGFKEIKSIRLNKYISLNINDYSDSLMELRTDVEKEVGLIEQSALISKEAHINVVTTVNKETGRHPVLTIIRAALDETRAGNIVLLPLPHPLPVFLELNMEDILDRFRSLLVFKSHNPLINIMKRPWVTAESDSSEL